MWPSARYRNGASTCSAIACIASLVGVNACGSGSSTLVTSEQLPKNLGELERFVALNAVPRAVHDDDGCVRLAAPHLVDVGVVDDRRRSAAHNGERHPQLLDRIPELV